MVVNVPTCIKFPKFVNPIVSVAAGSAHAIALTIEGEMYAWGVGSYGAIGLKDRSTQKTPILIVIKDHQ